jgi:hypothetical protein
MIRRTSYQSRRKAPPRRACVDPGDPWNDDWTYSAGDKTHIEAHDQEEGEEWHDTGLIDLNGEPVWRITKYVRRPIGFVLPDEQAQ